MIEKLIRNFEKVFGKKDNKEVFFSPGRVNLIGEHIDFNGGFVFPCALDFGTYGVVSRRNDNTCRLYSGNIKGTKIKEFQLDKIIKEKEDGWVAYEKGVVSIFNDLDYKLNKGFDLYIFGNIPNGAGLSSSASVEVLMADILKETNNIDIDMIKMVQISQMAENKYVGVQCGIMDQFAIGMGKKDNAILLDCNTLKYDYVPIKLNNASIVIGNTNKKRGLAGSAYNARRKDCDDALKILQENGVDIKYLCQLSQTEYDKVKHLIKDENQIKRSRHAISENQRTLDAVELLKAGNIKSFGDLMNKSHLSLRDDYEVSCFELDTMVDAAWNTKGVIGSRMTGAGFGGCTVSIVENQYVDNFIKEVGKIYQEKTNKKADFYVANIGDGTRKLGDY